MKIVLQLLVGVRLKAIVNGLRDKLALILVFRLKRNGNILREIQESILLSRLMMVHCDLMNIMGWVRITQQMRIAEMSGFQKVSYQN
ncbi:hypothetical protein LG71_22655 [Pluralibacter gergoviae]|nr:hypothetical protein LG71_22655 [Pluralibacter gergoviae]